MDQSSRMPSRLGLLLGGASWILTLLYFIGQLVAQAAWKTPYSLLDNRVSDLGNTECGRTLANAYICSPLHAVMNATFVVTGVLILLGLFVTRSIWPRRRLTTWGLILLGVAGVGHSPDRTESGERQRAVPCHWRAQHPDRQCSDDLARTGHLARALGATDRASPC